MPGAAAYVDGEVGACGCTGQVCHMECHGRQGDVVGPALLLAKLCLHMLAQLRLRQRVQLRCVLNNAAHPALNQYDAPLDCRETSTCGS